MCDEERIDVGERPALFMDSGENIIGYDCQTVTDDHGNLLYLKKTVNGHFAVLAKCENIH